VSSPKDVEGSKKEEGREWGCSGVKNRPYGRISQMGKAGIEIEDGKERKGALQGGS